MRKKRFLAILAAIAISISFVTPLTAFATEVEEETDIIDDELEEGEQTTIAAPGADSDSSSNSNLSSSSNTGSSSSGTSGTTGSTNSGTKSSDSSLAHLGISPGSLSPAFSAGTHEYTASVDAGVTSISVAARPNSSKAVIASVSGAKSLAPGSNTVKVVVEAENGATSTYTITVNCGAASSSAQPSDQSQTDDSAQTGDEQTLEGEISAIEDPEDQTEKQSEVTFDSNGYLIYEGNAYMPSSMMPEGEYVSLDKYNKLYEQSQGQKARDMRVIIVGIVIIVLLLIVILNLALKLRDVRQDVKLGLDGVDDEDDGSEKKRKQKESRGRKSELKMTDTSMIPDVKLPEQTKTQKTAAAVKTQKPAKPEKPIVQKQEKAVVSKPAKASKSAKKAEDLEILDLNDL